MGITTNKKVHIDQKIVAFKVVRDEDESKSRDTAVGESSSDIVHMHERLERPDMLIGSTYKIKTPLTDDAMYVTINDIILNEDTDHEQRRPFEIFINSKNMDHFQWIVALTRIMSAVFRKGGDINFLVDELRSVFDPRGGYFKKGGKYMPSIVAEIGDVIETHLRMIGMINDDQMDDHQKAFLQEKLEQYRSKGSGSARTDKSRDSELDEDDDSFPADASLCPKCNRKSMIRMDNCQTCLNCGESKCG